MAKKENKFETHFPKEWLSHHSLYFESFFTHAFLTDLVRTLLLADEPRMITVLRAEVDSAGIDLVLTCGSTVRHVQLKALGRDHSPNDYMINESLATLDGGCVIWICYEQATMTIRFYHALVDPNGHALRTLLPKKPATKRKQGTKVPKVGYVGVKTRDANMKKASIAELAEVLFPR
ncbi:MAG: hypothetical protein JNM34_06670 [Chthonomonadaceae bacterium]|nr:hypothetical protein [Chthonomonadaceae bacterium]